MNRPRYLTTPKTVTPSLCNPRLGRSDSNTLPLLRNSCFFSAKSKRSGYFEDKRISLFFCHNREFACLLIYLPACVYVHLSMYTYCISLVCMYLPIKTSLYISIYIHLYISTYIYIYTFIYICILYPVFISIYLPIYLFIYLYIHIPIYTKYMSNFVYTHTYICPYVYTHIYIPVYRYILPIFYLSSLYIPGISTCCGECKEYTS